MTQQKLSHHVKISKTAERIVSSLQQPNRIAENCVEELEKTKIKTMSPIVIGMQDVSGILSIDKVDGRITVECVVQLSATVTLTMSSAV